MKIKEEEVINLVGIEDEDLRVLKRKENEGEKRGRKMKEGWVMVGRKIERLMKGKLREVKIGVYGVEIEKEEKIVRKVKNLVLLEEMM